MRTSGRRRMLAGLVAATLVTSVSGCVSRAQLLGLQSNVQVSTTTPALTQDQAAAVTGRALARAQQADSSRSAWAARTAFTGVALRTAAAAYAVNQVVDPTSDDAGAALAPAPPPTRVILTSDPGYPRSFLALSRPPGATTEELAVLTTDDARIPYRVASRARLLPGASVPATAANSRGAQPLADDEPGLVATPADAVRDYATLLATGSSGGTRFADDRVTVSVRDNAAGQARGVAKVATFGQRHRPTRDPIVALRTADGSALVIAAIERTDEFQVKKGAGYLAPPAAYKALAGGIAKITKQATVTTVQVVVLTLPPAGKGPARLIGFAELPFTVQAT